MRQIKDGVWINVDQIVSVRVVYDEEAYRVRMHKRIQEVLDAEDAGEPRPPVTEHILPDKFMSPRVTMSDGSFWHFWGESLEDVVRLVT